MIGHDARIECKAYLGRRWRHGVMDNTASAASALLFIAISIIIHRTVEKPIQLQQIRVHVWQLGHFI